VATVDRCAMRGEASIEMFSLENKSRNVQVARPILSVSIIDANLANNTAQCGSRK
jgi:hypothetical protein